MKNRRMLPMLVYLLALVLLMSWASGGFGMRTTKLSHTQLIDLFEAEQVKSFVIQGSKIELTLNGTYEGKEKILCELGDPEYFLAQTEELRAAQMESGILTGYNFLPEIPVTPMDYVVPLLIAGGILLLLWFLLMGRASGNNPMNNFGKARTVLGVPDGRKVTFADVAGADEEKQELQEIVDFLRNPEKFREMGARIPHGILLVGPPGTGKTLLARAAAGEAEVQFLSISGSDFVEMYVGVGASRVRDLFDQAKKAAPAIIFIDEIDAVGRKRGSGLGGGHDEKEQTLNQLLVEMDGFGSNEGVIVIAATNRHDILDPALLRPGRFDRHIFVNPPDAQGREEILHVHARNKKLSGDVDLKLIANSTAGFTGADLENLLNEAALLSARNNCPVITMQALEDAVIKVIAGPEKRSHVQRERDLRITAYHEAGHAIAMYFLPTHDPVQRITIVPRGRALGMTISVPEADSSHMTRNQMRERIVSLLGGRIAEHLEFDDISTGASNDIERATEVARRMVTKFGMSDKLGPVCYAGSDGNEVFLGRDFGHTRNHSEEVAAQIDAEVHRILTDGYAETERKLKEHMDKLTAVAEQLILNEKMDGDEFRHIMEA